MIRVSIPIDVGTVAATGSSAFALATPVRIERLVALAVTQALGPRAPADKRARSVGRALEGLGDGAFVVEVDGRTYGRGDDVVVCAGVAVLRFFATDSRSSPLSAH